ncbi:hypothetical protein CK203_015871 [Vitis vinifera]|uniref:Endonuclease/exonuclease/phosphatase domain-containing protein n=1 Tax=Vitis vinifera TaxID=29760 RepID=A0A438JRU0_VITVI|nr:hypothetical protein CK203_103401 [Vitis vinifera]RVX11659.1 hypothetical protein CK203_015871 [Vitis vinifera]
MKALIKSQKVDLACLQETKIQEMSNGIVRSLGVGRCLEWCVVNLRGAAGNFNTIGFLLELSRGGKLSSTMRRFSKVIKELELRDLPLQGDSFTWSNG